MFLMQNKSFFALAARILGLLLVYVNNNKSVNAIVLDRTELNKLMPNFIEETKLDLSDRGIESIHVSTFAGLDKLKELFLNK
jgi:hypothetical protein